MPTPSANTATAPSSKATSATSICLNRIFSERRITRVAHLAAMAGVRESVGQTRLYMDVNLTGTMNLLEAGASADIEQFVLASTSSRLWQD